MKILLYSKSNFIQDELNKESSFFKDLTVIKSLENIERDIKSNSYLIVLSLDIMQKEVCCQVLSDVL